jgi:hypothetical protein
LRSKEEVQEGKRKRGEREGRGRRDLWTEEKKKLQNP